MGLTGGFADVGSLFDALLAIHNQTVKDTSILTEYSRVRINKWKTVIDPMSRKNFDLIWNPESQQARDEFFALCKKAESDRDLATAMAHVSFISISNTGSNKNHADNSCTVNSCPERKLRGVHQSGVSGT